MAKQSGPASRLKWIGTASSADALFRVTDIAGFQSWAGDRLDGGEVLHYWGHPLLSKLPRRFQPQGKVGHQYLRSSTPAQTADLLEGMRDALASAAPHVTAAAPFAPGKSFDEAMKIARSDAKKWKRVRGVFTFRGRRDFITLNVEDSQDSTDASAAATALTKIAGLVTLGGFPSLAIAISGKLECAITPDATELVLLYLFLPTAAEKRAGRKLAETSSKEREIGKIELPSGIAVLADPRLAARDIDVAFDGLKRGELAAGALKSKRATAIGLARGRYRVTIRDAEPNLVRLVRVA